MLKHVQTKIINNLSENSMHVCVCTSVFVSINKFSCEPWDAVHVDIIIVSWRSGQVIMGPWYLHFAP